MAATPSTGSPFAGFGGSPMDQTSPTNTSPNDKMPRTYIEKSHFSPWSSSPAVSQLPTSQPSPIYASSQLQFRNSFYSDSEDDMMVDNQVTDMVSHRGMERSFGGGERMDTPIKSHFVHGVSRHLPAQFCHSMTLADGSRNMDRRPPSPISEGETSPLTTRDPAMNHEMQMEVDEASVPDKVTPKKGHSRMKHSLRNWTGFSPDAAPTKKFSMGYRSDCEKCRDGVLGHYSHIITLPNGYGD